MSLILTLLNLAFFDTFELVHVACSWPSSYSRSYTGFGFGIPSVTVINLSDHVRVSFDGLVTSITHTGSETVNMTYINEHNSTLFKEAMATTAIITAGSVDDHLIQFESEMLKALLMLLHKFIRLKEYLVQA